MEEAIKNLKEIYSNYSVMMAGNEEASYWIDLFILDLKAVEGGERFENKLAAN